MAREIRFGDVGTRFDFAIVENGGGAIDLVEENYIEAKVKFSPVIGEPLERDMAVVSPGLASYTVQENDFAAGLWRLQGYVKTPAGEWRSQIETFTVHAPNL